MTLVNLSQLVEPIMTGFRDTTNPRDVPTNSDIARKTHLQNGLVNYTHVAQSRTILRKSLHRQAIPIDVAAPATSTRWTSTRPTQALFRCGTDC